MTNTLKIDEFMHKSFVKRDVILSPWLAKQSLNMIYAPRGLGKSHLSLLIACAVGSGSQALKWQATAPYGVLYVDSEMCASELQERLKKIIEKLPNPITAPFKIITPDCQLNNKLPDLATEAGQATMEAEITDDIDVIIFDNLSSLLKSKPESWLNVQDWLLNLKSNGKAIILIHHANKLGEQRGTSRREDALDVVICLKKPKDYVQSDGARFIVTFEKERTLYGEDVQTFEAKLISPGNFKIIEEDKEETTESNAISTTNTIKQRSINSETAGSILSWSILVICVVVAYLIATF